MYGFFLQADFWKLQECLNYYINQPSGYNRPSGNLLNYQPATNLILLNFVTINQQRSTEVCDWRLGYSQEREAAIWTLAENIATFPRRPGAYIPYMFVDNMAALASGREMYGFAKQAGQLTIPAPDAPANHFGLCAFAVRRYGPDQQFCFRKLLSVDAVVEQTATLQTTWRTADEALAALARIVDPTRGVAASARAMAASSVTAPPAASPPLYPGGRLLPAAAVTPAETASSSPALAERSVVSGDFAMSILTGAVPLIFLKQFRHAADARLACYQAVIETTAQLTGYNGGGMLGDYNITLHDLQSQPIGRELGLTPGTFQAHAAFWLDFDFQVLPGVVLWEAG
jgi:hypothetical protein